ncbi:hypothetical protein [Marinicella meishanensis]|uniref:hypothetical protein n=1 Tax=Marinicella meishanensis TaxID=2873263 RepID=UPI001CBAF950
MNKSEYQKLLENELKEKYGTLINSKDLYPLLGFPSLAAFRKGVQRKTIEIPILVFPQRQGKFALAKDVAELLTNARFKSVGDEEMK